MKRAKSESGLNGASEAVVELISCPVCLEPAFAPIRQCQQGHLTCNSW